MPTQTELVAELLKNARDSGGVAESQDLPKYISSDRYKGFNVIFSGTKEHFYAHAETIVLEPNGAERVIDYHASGNNMEEVRKKIYTYINATRK